MAFFNAVTTPTRVSCNRSTLLDLFITNIEIENATTGVILSDISDNFPIFSFVESKAALGRSCDEPPVQV